MQRLLPLLALAAAPTLGAAQQSVDVDFASGTLGWIGPNGFGGSSGINPTGGVDGGPGYRVDFSDFFITVSNSLNPAFLGDYTLFDSVTISHDVRVDQIDFFFSAVPRPWFVELRNYDLAVGGFPWTSVWFKFADISAAAHGSWTNFAVTIDDPTSTTLPAGWKGYGAEAPGTFEPILPPGVTFADVLAGVDEIVFSTGEPGFFFGQTDFDLTLDNISIETTGGPWSDLGSGLAGGGGVPQLYAAGPVTDGSETSIGLSNTAPGVATFLVVGFSNPNLPLFGGTLISSADIAVLPGQANGQGASSLGIPWPAGLASGTDVYWQYWTLDPSGPLGITASNGLVCTTP